MIKIETILSRIERKEAAIAKRAATTKKHATLVLKKAAKGEERDLYNVEQSAKELKYLIIELRQLKQALVEAKKNEVVLPEILETFCEELKNSFIKSRTSYRDYLASKLPTYKKMRNSYKSINEYDAFSNMMDTYKYFFGKKTYPYTKEHQGPMTLRQQKLVKFAKIYIRANNWWSEYHEKAIETNESIEKRSANDAKDLVKDFYKRVIAFTGEITELNGLYIDVDNNGFSVINGIVEGKEGKCKVESISAGGYNIQCWHIRLLVKAFRA